MWQLNLAQSSVNDMFVAFQVGEGKTNKSWMANIGTTFGTAAVLGGTGAKGLFF